MSLLSGNLPRHMSSVPDFLHRSALGVATVALLLLSPFALNNFIQGRFVLGLGALAIVMICAVNAWTILCLKRYYALFTLFGLVPAILFFLSLSLRNQGLIGVFWCFPAVISFYFMLPERMAWAANVLLLLVAFPLALDVLEPAPATRLAATLLMVSVLSAMFMRVITRQQAALRAQIVTDPLTGAFNRTLLEPTLEHATAQSSALKLSVTLLALDIDHFKCINDTFGHHMGDTVLRSVGTLLKERVRKTDTVFRTGGEEFLIVLNGADAAAAQQVAEEVRCAVATLEILPNHTVTASIGLAVLEPEEDWEAWVKRADARLYRAKAGGRNQTIGAHRVQPLAVG